MEEWRDVQNMNRKKEESFSCEAFDLYSATQIQSPHKSSDDNQNNIFLDKKLIERNNNMENIMELDVFKNSNAQNGGIPNVLQLDDLSLSRDQSRNLQFTSQSKNLSLTNQHKRQTAYKKQNIINSSDNVGSQTKSAIQQTNLNSQNNLQNTNLNVIMRIKKKISQFQNNHTFFGRNRVFEKNDQIRKMIGDKSDGQLLRQSSFFLNILVRMMQIFKLIKLQRKISFDIPMIASQNTIVFIWQIYITIYNNLFMLLLSFILIFSATKNSSEIENIIFNITFYQWIIQIAIQLNTTTFYKTTLFNTRGEVLRLYIKSKFIYDILPLILILFPSDNSIFQQAMFRIPIFLKLINMSREQKEIEKQLMMILDNFFLIQLVNLVVNLFLVGHFIACLWYIVSIIDQNYLDNENSWIQTSLGVDGVWWKIYLNAFYWSFTLMATGSNTANTIIEMFFTSIVMLFTTVVFGYMVNMIGIILSEINQLEENKMRDINIINKFMKRKHISKDLQRRVNLDLEYLYLRSMKQKSEEENSVISKISLDIQNKIKIESSKSIVSRIKCIVDNFSEETINMLCQEFQEEFYSPNQIVFNEGDINDPSLMFLVSGQVDLFKEVKFLKTDNEKQSSKGGQIDYKIEKQSKFIISLKKGTVFGELNFFTGMGRKLTAKSKQFTTILKINRESFLQILSKNEQDFEKFCEIKDKILQYSDFGPLKLGCSLCQSSYHFESECPTSHIKKDSQFIFARYNFSANQKRNEDLNQNRKQYKKPHSYQQRQFYIEKAALIQQNYELSFPQNGEDNNNFKTDSDEENLDTDNYQNLNGSSNDDGDNSKNTFNTSQDQNNEDSPEQQAMTQAVSKFSLLNGFTTIDDKTKKTELTRDKQNSQYYQKYDLLNSTVQDSILKNNLYEDSSSLNIPTLQNNVSTPKRLSKGTTNYQSSGDRTEFTAFINQQNMEKDTIKEEEHHRKDMLKQRRKSKVSEETRKRMSVRTEKKRRNTYKKSQYYAKEGQYEDGDKNMINLSTIKPLSLHNETQAAYYEKLMLSSLWNFDNIKTFLNYFPTGNYIPSVNKFNTQRKKFLKNKNCSSDHQKSKLIGGIKKKWYDSK